MAAPAPPGASDPASQSPWCARNEPPAIVAGPTAGTTTVEYARRVPLTEAESNALARARGLPADAMGVGLRLPHDAWLREHTPELDFFEVIAENFTGGSTPPRERLAHVRARWPIVLHGVSLDLLGPSPLDDAWLDTLARLADSLDAPYVTDHLCWTGARGVSHHDLLPTPYRPDLVEYAAERAWAVQRRLGRPFGLENLSSYVTFRDSTMTEWDFFAAVVRESGTWLLLDVNNLHVSAHNHGFDPLAPLDAVDWSRVLQVHLAGHAAPADGLLVDTHDHPVCAATWALYREAWRRGGPFPTLLERDANLPPFPELLDELARARRERA